MAPPSGQNLPALVISPQDNIKDPNNENFEEYPKECLEEYQDGARMIRAEHPLPGRGSFLAGAALLDFFDSLHRFRARTLRVYLSGGASSLAWLPPSGLSEEELLVRLRLLYRRPLSIDQLNRERAALCGLKRGGAARWLQRLAPGVRARVSVISDVLPFGPEVIGSGPFFDGRVPHRIWADNTTLLHGLAAEAAKAGVKRLAIRPGSVESWQDWVSWLSGNAQAALRSGRSGLILMGGEPRVSLPKRALANPPANAATHSSHTEIGGKFKRSGGRQTHLAAALAVKLHRPLLEGRIQIACMSSDGVDGRSGAAGAFLNRRTARALENSGGPGWLKRELSRFMAAPALERIGALVPECATGTNVQDVAAIWIIGPSS